MNKISAKLTTLLLTLSLSSGFAQLTSKSAQIAGENRTWKQYLPVNFDPQSESLSLVVALHGLGGSNNDMVSAGFNYLADTARIMVMYPQGATNGFGQAAWNNGTLLSSSVDDIAFMNALIDSAILHYNIDPSRVYFTGFSMGSIMSHHLACALNGRVAAIGCMSGTMATSDIETCVPDYATPVIHLHGTADGTVPYDGTALPSLSLVAETMNFWRGVHGCDAQADSTRMDDLASDGITVDRFVYNNCEPAGSLELWRLNGADHEYLYKPVNDITEMIEIWLFFRRWTHPAPAAAGLNELSDVHISVSPNPSEKEFAVKSDRQIRAIVRSLDDRIVWSGELQDGITVLSFDEPAGVYVLQVGSVCSKLVRL